MGDLDRFQFNKQDTAAIMGVSVQALGQWKIQPVAKQGRQVFYDIRQVFQYRMERDLDDGGNNRKLNLQDEQARFAKVRADAAEMENAKRRGELIEIEAAVDLLETTVMAVRSRILSIPTKAAPAVAGCKTPRQAQVVLEQQIHDALDELASLDPEVLRETEDGDPKIPPAAKIDDQPVGGHKKKIKRRK